MAGLGDWTLESSGSHVPAGRAAPLIRIAKPTGATAPCGTCPAVSLAVELFRDGVQRNREMDAAAWPNAITPSKDPQPEITSRMAAAKSRKGAPGLGTGQVYLVEGLPELFETTSGPFTNAKSANLDSLWQMRRMAARHDFWLPP